MDDIKTVNNEQQSRYELYVGDTLATIAEYRRSGDTIVFTHTETGGAFRGQGLAERLVRYALDDVVEHRWTVVPRCWFVADVIENNPQYADLVAA